jgi:GntR family transcriptional regulator
MSAPKYREVADKLRERLDDGEWNPGEVLPRHADLAEVYGVSRNVIAAAVKVLEIEGRLRAVPKRGTVVQQPGPRTRIQRGAVVVRDVLGVVPGMDIPQGSYSFPSSSHRREWTVHGAPARSVEPITERAAELLAVEPGSPVLRRRRVTSPKGEAPYQLADTWIHPTAVDEAPRVADANPGPGGVLDRLEEAGHGPLEWHEIARARRPSREEANLLEISTDQSVMEFARVGVSARTDAAVEVTMCVVPADRVEIVTPIRRDKSAQWPTPNQPA